MIFRSILKRKLALMILIGVFLISLLILKKDYMNSAMIFTTNFNHKLSLILQENFLHHRNTYKYINYLSAKKIFSFLINDKNKIIKIDINLQDIHGFDLYLSKINIKKEFMEIKNNQIISYAKCMRLIYDPLESEKDIYINHMNRNEYKNRINSLYKIKNTPLFIMMCHNSVSHEARIFIDQNNYIIVEGRFKE